MKYERLILSVLLMVLVTVFLSGCQTQKASSTTGHTFEQSPETIRDDTEIEDTILGVIKAIDSAQNSVMIYDIENQVDMIYTYTGGTDIRDSHDKMITIHQLELGEIVTGYYDYAERKLLKLSIDSEAWTYNGVDTLSMEQSEHRITIAKKLYQYDDRIVITDGVRLLDPIDLNEKDELTVKGIGKSIYSIRVTKGHGYIRLKNYEAFVGGTIEVGYGIIAPVVDDMLLVAREGSYRVVLENGELQAVKTINLYRDEEVTLDLSDYKAPAERVGHIRFNINPVGADLYVNGILINYADTVKLNYGEHVIRVSLTGYKDFTGILSIGEATSIIHISLAEEGSASNLSGTTQGSSSGSVESGTSSTEIADKDSNTTLEEKETASDETETIEIDEDHTITILEPEGAKVYLNGVLRGTVPLTIPKEIGTHTITLSKSGYATKSYTIEVENNGEDFKFSFPNMTAAE